MPYKPKVFLTSNVFSDKEIGSNQRISKDIRNYIIDLWNQLNQISILKVFNGRFPSNDQLKKEITSFNPEIIGCHLSHPISLEFLENTNVFAISTSTTGFNHIERPTKDDIIITHTPGILHETVADYTIAIIMATLRNLIDLHTYVWNEQWSSEDKWDLDKLLSNVISNKVLGIIGLGEIGKEIVKKLYPWGIKILYYDIKKMKEFENEYPLIEFKDNLKDIFVVSDIITLHIPLNEQTKYLVNQDLLKLTKQDALLVNTARGPILDLDSLLTMLENKELQINLALDVFPKEPIEKKVLDRIKKIKKEQPDIRIVLLPHNASADANTRGRMAVLFLQDLIKLIKSKSVDDLEEIHIIPEQKIQLKEKKWKIINYWDKK